MAFRMFLFDIDGTLTDRSTDKIPEANVTTLKRLREQGYLVVICTGRMHKAAPMLKEAGVEYDYIIGASGHVIADGNDQEFSIDLFFVIHFSHGDCSPASEAFRPASAFD